MQNAVAHRSKRCSVSGPSASGARAVSATAAYERRARTAALESASETKRMHARPQATSNAMNALS